MKLLQICKKFPFPVKDGESIAVTNLGIAYSQLGVEVTLLAMNTSKHPVDVNLLPIDYAKGYKKIHFVKVNNNLSIKEAIVNLFQKESYHVTRFINADYRSKLIEILTSEHFDVVQIETVFLAPYIETIRVYSNATIVLRTHNVEHEIWKRVADLTDFGPKRWYLNFLNKKLRRFEIESLNKCDLLLPITERDLRIFRLLGYSGQAVATPVGLDARSYPIDERLNTKKISMGFIGSLDWMPNQEGLKWFIDNVWRHYDKNVELHIAGRNAPDWFKNLRMKNVIFHGEVTDARDFIKQYPIALVPLFSGSGIRVKILEAMMLGRIVLTTTIGLEGIHAVDGEEVLVANTDYDFQAKIDLCIKNPKLVHQMGRNARKLMETDFNTIKIASKVLEMLNSYIKVDVQKVKIP